MATYGRLSNVTLEWATVGTSYSTISPQTNNALSFYGLGGVGGATVQVKNLSKGIYYAEIKSAGISEKTRFIKE